MDRAIRPHYPGQARLQEGRRMDFPPPPPPPPPAMSGCASLATRRYLPLTSLHSLHAH
ncbi:hypothetical protein PVAP13_1KG490005 [Panicum virgatum]|uniref:Uncharacterized protein n=1 Tax=Panicum virgatum TaxID=38727 RepID=A0A8T0XMU2_PANVG|nr:hypothetical protein PVAP13_1KG490005 [Panicum virgatum]